MCAHHHFFLSTFCIAGVLCPAVLLGGDSSIEGSPAAFVPIRNNSLWIVSQIDKYRNFPKIDLAMRLLKSGRAIEARRELQSVLARKPEDLKAASSYIVVLYDLRDYPEVINRSTSLLRHYSSFAPAVMYRGLAYQALGDRHKALEDFSALQSRTDLDTTDRIFCLETVVDLALDEKDYNRALNAIELLKAFKKDSHLYYAEGIALQALGRTSEAATAIHSALDFARDPRERLTLLQTLSMIDRLRGDWKRAWDVSQAALKLDPQNTDVLRAAAEAAYHSDHYAEAARIVRQVLAVRPCAADWKYLANILVAQREYKAAEEQFDLCRRQTHDVAQLVDIYRALVELARLRKDAPEAIRLLKLLLSIRPSEQDRRSLFYLLEEQKDYPALIRELEWTLAHSANSNLERYEAYMKLGNIYYGRNQLDRAMVAFREAVKLNKNTAAMNSLAQTLEESGSIREAITVRGEACRSHPDAMNYLKLADLYEKAAQPNEALHSLNAALEAGPLPELLPDIYRRQGYLHAGQRNQQEARLAFGRALELAENRPDLHVALAEICIEMHDYQHALPHLERTQELESSDRVLRMLAFVYSETDQLTKSAGAYELLLKRVAHPSPEAEELETKLAYVEARRKNFDRAGDLFLRAFEDGSKLRLILLEEAAQQYFEGQNWNRAAQAYDAVLRESGRSAPSEPIVWQHLAVCQIKLGLFQAAADSVQRGQLASDVRGELQARLGFIYYERQEWKLSLDQFLASLGAKVSVPSLLGAARCYQHLNKPGLAIYYFSQALEGGELRPPERESALADLGHLYTRLAEYNSAADVWDRCIRLKEDPVTRLQLARVRRLSNQFGAAEEALQRVNPEELPSDRRSEYFDERFALLKYRGNIEAAVDVLRLANQLAPAAWRDYELGLFAISQDKVQEAISDFRTALGKEPDSGIYAQALAYAFERAGDQQNAGWLFNVLAERDPENPEWRKALAYVNMRLSRNAEAAEALRLALDRTARVEDSRNALQEDYALRSEISRLTHRYDFTFYHGNISNGHIGGATGALLGSEIFPASTGIEAAYQPPRIGLRNGKTLQIFGRLLWASESNSFGFDTKRYQGSAGVRYRPFAQPNLWISAERLFHAADRFGKGWLLRGLYSWNLSSDARPARKASRYVYALTDSAYVSGGGHYFAQYGEIRQGLTISLANNLFFTPHFVEDTRWQSQTRAVGSYIEAGGGASVRYVFGQSRYEAPHSSFEVLLQFKRGMIFRQGGSWMGNVGYDGCSLVGIFRL